LKIVRNAILRNKVREAPRSFSVWGQNGLVGNKSSLYAQGVVQKMRRTIVTGHAGVPMDSTDLKSEECSGCVAWKKLRPSTWKH
jgi:hypothetical protein